MVTANTQSIPYSGYLVVDVTVGEEDPGQIQRRAVPGSVRPQGGAGSLCDTAGWRDSPLCVGRGDKEIQHPAPSSRQEPWVVRGRAWQTSVSFSGYGRTVPCDGR